MADNNILWSDRKRPIFGLPLSFTKYTLTEERLIINTGFLNLKEDECRLYRVLDIVLNRSLFQRMFGVGTISVQSSDKSLKNFEIKNVKKPKEFKELFSEQVEAVREKKRVVSREFMSDSDDDFDGDDDN